MPPIKGAPLKKQSSLGFRAAKHALHSHKPTFKPVPYKKGKPGDESILKLRIPTELCKTLPSVKKFKRPVKMEIKEEETEDNDQKPTPQMLLGAKKKRGEQQKYRLKLLGEERIPGMIWDMVFLQDGSIVVGSSEGAYHCGPHLDQPRKLDNIVVAGGMGILADGKLVIICRFMDTINIFTQTGTFLKSFTAGFCPMSLAINSKDEIIVTDTGTKCLRIYNTSGKLQRTIASQGRGYSLRWPLYVSVNNEDHIVLTDCHTQSILIFDARGSYMRDFPLKTFGGNYVLKPHGICVNQDDIFVVDCAIDSMEVFLSDGTYLQTLLPSEEGVLFKPKVTRTSPYGDHLLIGGMSGTVRLYRFVSEIKEENQNDAIKQDCDSNQTDVIVLDD